MSASAPTSLRDHHAPSRPPLRGAQVRVSSPHEIVRAGLRSVIDTAPCAGAGYDVALFDLAHSDALSAAALGRAIARPETAVLVLVRPEEPQLGDRALDLGVDGCVLLSSSRAELHAAIRAARTGRLRTVRPPTGGRYDLNPVPAADDPAAAQLSLRELETLALVCRGFNNHEIAAELYIGVNTIKTYIRSAYRKIGVDRRTQAVCWGIEHRIGDHARRRTVH